MSEQLPAVVPQQPPATAPVQLVVDRKSLKKGGHTFVPAMLGGAKGKLLRFSQREVQFLSKFTETWALQEACDEIGITLELGRKYLKRKNIQTYLEEQFRMAALEAGTDARNHMAWLREVRDGVEIPTDKQLEAAKIISRHLRPSGPGVQVNVQQNVNQTVVGASRFAGMTKEQMEQEWRERLDAR